MEPRGFVEEYLRGLYGDAGPTSVTLPPMAQPTVIDRAPLAPSAPPVAAQAAPVAQPLDYMRALDEAQRQDEIEAALQRVGGSVGQVAQIVSRGAYQPPPMAAPASRGSQLAQRQQVVEDYLRQQREGELSAAQLEATRALAAQRLRQPAERVALETEAQRKEREASATRQLALAEKAQKETAQAGKPKAVKPPKTEEKLDPAASKLRNEFNHLPEVKTFNDAESSYRRMQVAAENPSPAGDIALVFSFMKLNDPGSTVREGEQAQARNAAGVPDQVRNQYNRLLSGESLTAEQRKDFMTQGLRFRNVEAEKFNRRADFYADLAKRSNLKIEDILQRAPQADGAAPTATASAAAPGMVRVRDNKTQRIKEFPEADAMKLVNDPSNRFEVVR